MFVELFYALRARGVPVTPLEWLTLMEALALGLAHADAVGFYHLVRTICVKSETLYDAYDQAWLSVFTDVEIPGGLREEILKWLADPKLPPRLSPEEMARFESMDLDALREAFERRLAEQKSRHDGGSHWIGTGGTSPFGHGGYHPGGIRVGGQGGGRMAAQIASKRAFAGYRSDRVLDTRQMGLALKKLRRLAREGARLEVDIDGTIEATARNAGDITVVERAERISDLRVALLMDAGGSMWPYAALVERLFSAARRASHFKDLQAYFFHNCVYSEIYAGLRDWTPVDTLDLMRTLKPTHRLILVGDACMAPSELLMPWGAIDYGHRNDTAGVVWLERLADHFDRSVWLNPMRLHQWRHPTVERIREIFPMFELTLDGLEGAMSHLGGQSVEPPTPVLATQVVAQ